MRYLLLALVVFSMPAMAQVSGKFDLVNRSITNLGTASTQVVAINRSRKFLMIHNPSASITVACSLGGVTAAINGAGSVTLLPLSTLTLEDGPIAQNAINCIASSGSSNVLTIWEG